MPVYCFRRKSDGNIVEEIFPIGKAPAVVMCEDGVEAKRDFAAEGKPDLQPGRTDKYLCRGLAILPHQIPEAQRLFPHHRYAPDGQMIYSNYAEKKQIMKDLGGFHDLDG